MVSRFNFQLINFLSHFDFAIPYTYFFRFHFETCSTSISWSSSKRRSNGRSVCVFFIFRLMNLPRHLFVYIASPALGRGRFVFEFLKFVFQKALNSLSLCIALNNNNCFTRNYQKYYKQQCWEFQISWNMFVHFQHFGNSLGPEVRKYSCNVDIVLRKN
jgi:hypothetical protein